MTPRENVATATEALLNELVAYVRRYVVLKDSQAATVALWIMHTHAIDAADVTPYLAILSAEKRSGKSRLLEVLSLLVARPLSTANISDAALYRSIADEQPTLLFDEVDAIFGAKARDREDLRGLLNAGYRRGQFVIRMGGPTMTTREKFAVFCTKAFAGIGRLSDTIMDRSIILNLKRKAPDEAAQRFRWREANAETEGLRQRLQAWGGGNLEALAVARPDSPEELDDRAAEGWEPLLAIADLAGGAWPRRARSAALDLSAGEAREDDSPGILLLADLRSIFEERHAEKLPSSQLAQELASLEESPWGDLRGRPLDARGLAQRLRRYEIRPKTIRLNECTIKGYAREQFEPSWQRYLQSAAPSPPASNVTPSQPASLHQQLSLWDVSRDALTTAAEEGLNPHGYADVTLVTRAAPANRAHDSTETPANSGADDLLRPILGDPGFEGLTRRRFLEGHLTELERDTLVAFHRIRRQRAKVLERSPERHEAATE